MRNVEATILTRKCRRCGEVKPEAENFSVVSGHPHLHKWTCKACVSAMSQEWKRAHPGRVREYKSTTEYREKQRRRTRQYRAQDPEGWRVRDRLASLKYRYGITGEQYMEMYRAQHGRCAICSAEKEPSIRGCVGMSRDAVLVVDHCHRTNKVRGLLCDRCNKALGLFFDNQINLQRAASYAAAGGL